jgi:iron complex outermembrane recepter protein
MANKAFGRAVLAASILGTGTAAHAGPDGWGTPTVVAQAQTSPEAGERAPQTAPAQPAPAAPQPPTPPAASKEPAGPAEPQPGTATRSPGAIELPPVKIIQPQAPERPKPAEKAAPTPKRAPARIAAPAARPQRAAPEVRPAPAPEATPSAAELAEQTVAMTPIKGSEIPLDKVPGAVSQVSSANIQSSGSPALQDALQQYVPGAIISDVNGNPFSVDIQYRGFTASPVEGTPQGLAVYQNGVRINEVFGDTVNWDLIPSNAISGVTVVSGNPLYGLNALGGALNIAMKDGFSYQGVESDTRAGSFGRFQEAIQAGKQVGNFAAYVAVEGIHDSGWREFSPSDVKRMYVDLGARDKDTEFHINFTGAESKLGVVGPAPVELLAQNYGAVFTSPQTTENQLAMLSANGSVKLSSTWTASGVAYVRSFHQSHVDGNVSSVAPCNVLNAQNATPPETPSYDPNSPLCLQTADGSIVPVTDQQGKQVLTGKYYGPNATIGEIDYTTNNTTSYGTSLQATDKEKLFGLDNIFIAGASVDHGDVKSTSIAELGTLNTQNFVVTGNGVFLSSPLDIAPVNLTTTTNYYGLFFTDTLDLTKSLSATVGGRYNYEELQLSDPTGHLTGDHIYTRFNPMAGLTYKFNSHISAYGGYSEANRAPTPAELSCADPNQPCLLQNFLVSDPDLKQVVSKTWQAGFRGNFSPFGHGRLDWSAGVFHTENFDDILNVTDPTIPTRGYFLNAGNSLRQGVEASANYKWEGLTVNANYAYVDAIFLSNLTLPSPNNPFADGDGNIFVHPGDKIPTIPAHRLKASFDYDVTDQWKVGADAVLASSQYFFGDQSNQNPQLPGYGVVNLRTSYEIEKGVTLYGLITNVFDHKYATYGTFYDLQIQNVSGQASTNLTNADMITPGQPLSVYGGLRIKF